MKLVLCLLAFLACTQAYCIYNRSKRYILWANQLEMHATTNKDKRFRYRISDDRGQCCHFSEGDCNSTGDPRTVIEFAFQFFNGSIKVGDMFTSTAPAGGWVEVDVDSKPFVYYADGTPFPNTYHVNERH